MVVRGLLSSFCLLSSVLFAIHEEVIPYLLPPDHPIKSQLDALFSQSRVTLNLETLEEAGFTPIKRQKYTEIVVTSHPSLPGYIFKLYLDAQRYHAQKPEYTFWILRVQGSQLVRETIEKYQLQTQFKVPQKWIYALPDRPEASTDYQPKSYILVEDNMNLISRSENKKRWGSNQITPKLLHELYVILTETGLSDSAKPDNAPFSTDGRIAFIDTQLFNQKKVKYEKLTPYLSNKNKKYWKALTKD